MSECADLTFSQLTAASALCVRALPPQAASPRVTAGENARTETPVSRHSEPGQWHVASRNAALPAETFLRDDAPDLAAVNVEFAGDRALAVTGGVPGTYRLLQAWCFRP